MKDHVEEYVRGFCEQNRCEILELNVQEDHIHLLAMMPPRISISALMGILKGRTAIRIFNQFRGLKNRLYWGNRFWARGYCVDTVGLNEEMIWKYVKYQEAQERALEK